MKIKYFLIPLKHNFLSSFALISIIGFPVQAMLPPDIGLNSTEMISKFERTKVSPVPAKGLLYPTEKSYPKGFSKNLYSSKQSSSKNSNLWYEESYYSTSTDKFSQLLITFKEYAVQTFKSGEQSNNRNKSYVYLVKESIDTIEAFGGIGQYFTYAGKQGFVRYGMVSVDHETYNLIWDDSGKVLIIELVIPTGLYTAKDVIAILPTLRRSDGKKLVANPVNNKPPEFISKPIGIDSNFKGKSIEGEWGAQSGSFGMPDIGINGLLVPSDKTTTPDYYYLRTNIERRSDTEGMVRYVLYADQSLTPMSLRFDMSSDKTYASIVELKNMLTKGGQSGKSKVIKQSFTYNNQNGVVYTYWHHNRLNYELHWDDEGKDVHIRMEHVPTSYKFSPTKLINLLSTLRRSDGFYANLLTLATSTNQRSPILYEASIEKHKRLLQSPPPKDLLVPTKKSLKPHFSNIRQTGMLDGYEVIYSPQNLSNRFSGLTDQIIVFREFLNTNKPNSYEALSKKDSTNFLHSDIPPNFDTNPLSIPPPASWPSDLKKTVLNFTHNNRNGILYSYEGSTTMAYSLHYDDDGKDLQIMIRNIPKTLYTNQEVIDILKTMERFDGEDFVKKDILAMLEATDKYATDNFSIAASGTWHFLKGFLGPTKASFPKNGYYRLTLEPFTDNNDLTFNHKLSNRERGSYRLKYYLHPDSSNVFFFKETLKVGTSTPYETLSKNAYEFLVQERNKTLETGYKFISQSIASEISTQHFTYKGSKGVLYYYTISQGCLFYNLHYNDNGNNMEISPWFCNKEDKYTPQQVIDILGTLKRY